MASKPCTPGARALAVSIPLEETAKHRPSELAGLSAAEVESRRAQFGPNAVVEEEAHPLKRLARQFWVPVPWMLEATTVLQVAIGQWLTAAMIAALLLFNVALGAFQESRANAALALLKQRLTLKSRVKRDRVWIDAPAVDLVPGDIVQISLGDVIPADILLIDGSLLIDQSMLTGESIPTETEAGSAAYAGGLVRRGAAIARVTATGTRTYYGRTAELVARVEIRLSTPSMYDRFLRIPAVHGSVFEPHDAVPSRRSRPGCADSNSGPARGSC